MPIKGRILITTAEKTRTRYIASPSFLLCRIKNTVEINDAGTAARANVIMVADGKRQVEKTTNSRIMKCIYILSARVRILRAVKLIISMEYRVRDGKKLAK